MANVQAIIRQVENLMKNENFPSPVMHAEIPDERLISTRAVVRQVEFLIREERYPLVLDRKEMLNIACPN